MKQKHRQIGRFVAKCTLLLIIPVILLELMCRKHSSDIRWFEAVERDVQDSNLNVFLLGSSRTNASIDEDLVKQKLNERFPTKQFRVYNLGMGSSTLLMFVLASRRLTYSHPAAVRNSIWLMEAPGGLPRVDTRDGGAWFDSTYKDQLLQVLSTPDLPLLWIAKQVSYDDKIYFTASHFSKLAKYIIGMRLRLITVGERAMNRWFFEKPKEPSSTPQLGQFVGIRNDISGIEFVRRRQTEAAQALKKVYSQFVPVSDWDRLLIHDWVTNLQNAGARPFFIKMPVPNIEDEQYSQPAKLKDAQTFKAACARWGTRLISFPFQTTNEDFPDLLHLGLPRRTAYSLKVVDQLAAIIGEN
jgi:hypothetical protein